jgi:hypothetical protein
VKTYFVENGFERVARAVRSHYGHGEKLPELEALDMAYQKP